MKPWSIGITCYPTYGGSGVIATEIGVSLARRGHRVHFIASDVPSRLDRFQPNVFFHAVETPDYPLFEHRPYALALASKMVQVATWERLDLLHVHYAIPHAASAYLARQMLGAKAPRVVTTLHGTDITLVGSDPSFLPITRFSILESNALTVPSAFLRRATFELLDIPEDTEIEVIPNFVDTEVFRPPARRDLALLVPLFPRAEGLLWPQTRVLVHNSNFRPLKRVDDVVSIFAEVHRAMPQTVLVLIGDGPERGRIEQQVQTLGLASCVCFLGKQRNFVEVLQQCDLFLLPSEAESFGLAALEALACGVPVVASRVGGLEEVILDGKLGFLLPKGDISAMAEAALRLLRDAELRARMSQAARTEVEKRWPREPMVDRYEACYERVLSG